jgi:hypothetical protein
MDDFCREKKMCTSIKKRTRCSEADDEASDENALILNIPNHKEFMRETFFTINDSNNSICFIPQDESFCKDLMLSLDTVSIRREKLTVRFESFSFDHVDEKSEIDPNYKSIFSFNANQITQKKSFFLRDINRLCDDIDFAISENSGCEGDFETEVVF